ncbi:Gfo/Idh/MocA family oxidoreductase [bacterium]|nr:Gfo/Idh/MocA family oxidoreductase [bacterium]
MDKNDKIKIGIVGMGLMGWQYAEVIRSLPDAELKWICEINDEKLHSASTHFTVDGYLDFKEVPLDNTDAVIIATPDNYHLEPALFFAQAKKHILVEKPLATSVQDGMAIIEASESSGVKLMVGHILRFDPRYVVVKQRIESGEIGDIIHMYARRNNLLSNAIRIGGRTSPLFFLAIHDIDILCWLKGAPPVKVFSIATSKLLRSLNTYDSAFLLLEWKDGTIGCIETSWVMPDYSPTGLDCQLEIVGERGAVHLRIDNQNLQIFKEKSEFPDTSYHLVLYDKAFGILRAEVEHFLDCIKNGKELAISAEEALLAVKIAAAAHKSIEEKKGVEI